MWERACSRRRLQPHPHKPSCPHSRASSLPQGICIHPTPSLRPLPTVGASLLAKASCASPSKPSCPHSRAGSLPHGICIHPANLTANRRPCGSWLASDGVLSVTSMAPVPPSSLASQLPQGFAFTGLAYVPTAPAAPVPVRWSRAAAPITRRCCRRRRNRGTGSPPGSHCCRRRSGS